MAVHDPDHLQLIQGLRGAIEGLVDDAARVAVETCEETERVRQVHDEEIAAMQMSYTLLVDQLRVALSSRDVIGQAKGIIMANTHCSAGEAFQLLVKQSQADNRKLVDNAAEIAARASRRVRPHRAIRPQQSRSR